VDYIALQEKRGANYVLLEVNGVITSNTFTEMQGKVYDMINKSNLVLDLSEVQKIDSSGLSVIMAAHNDGEEIGNKLYLMRPSLDARRAIESTGFLDTFNVIQSVTEVL
jgi:anti-anti-sigma factor